MRPDVSAMFNSLHARHVEAEQAQAMRRVGLMAARRAAENDRDPIEARQRALQMIADGAHGGALGPIVDEVAGPLNRQAFAIWMQTRRKVLV
jgi:hypothetical protein